VTRDAGDDPEREAVLADSVGLALLVVLEELTPPERLAFVLHDMFAVPFDEIAPMVDRSPDAARQLASRARRRVRGSSSASVPSRARQREVVDAFFAASRGGDFDALVAVLDPDIVLRSDAGAGAPGTVMVRGADAVAGRALMFAGPERITRAALVNGAAGVVVLIEGKPFAVMGFTVRGDRVAEIDVLLDPERVRRLDLAFLHD
jgi:Sigma-70, region 4